MFTGLVEEIGIIKESVNLGGGRKIKISANKILDDIKIDDSIAIDGVCQTVVSFSSNGFEVIAVEETLRKSTLGKLNVGSEVNLERALRATDRLGGHIVQGHVDTIATISRITKENTGVLIWVSFPKEFAKLIVNTGSICINGVSLTSAKVEYDSFYVAVIPHTFSVTTFKNLKIGSKVNLEFDIIGKYIDRILNIPKHNSKLEIFIDQPEY